MSEEQEEIRYYGVFDAGGWPQGFYNSDVHSEIPSTAVEITKAQWQEFLDHQAKRKWQDGEVVVGTPPPIEGAAEGPYFDVATGEMVE